MLAQVGRTCQSTKELHGCYLGTKEETRRVWAKSPVNAQTEIGTRTAAVVVN